MRNLKKILALVLALMMTLSLMATASAKDFTDADEIQYTEAVQVMTGLGVLNGYPDGSFGAKDPLVRAAAAKIVAYIMEGGFDAVEAKAEYLDNPFTDLGTASWLIASAKYLANEGMLLGYGDGRFGPNDPLTAAAFGKLVLLAAGIGTAEDYVTDATQTFETKVMVALKENGLLAGVKETITAKTVLNREQACQIAFNALTYGPTTVVTKYEIVGISTNFVNNHGLTQLVYGTKSAAISAAVNSAATNKVYNTDFTIEEKPVKVTDTTKSLLATAFDAKVATVLVTNNDANRADPDYKGYTTGINLDTGLSITFAAETGLNEIGRVVKVYYYQSPVAGNVAYSTSVVSNDVVISAAAAKAVNGAATAPKVLKAAIAALGISAVDYAAATEIEAVYGFDNYVENVANNKGDADVTPGYKMAAGTYVVYDGTLYSYMTDSSSVVKLTITKEFDRDDNLKEYDVTTTTGGTLLVDTNDDAPVNLVVSDTKIDWLSFVDTSVNPLNTTGYALFNVAVYGEKYYLSEIESFKGTVTKIAAGIVYVDGIPYYTSAAEAGLVSTLGTGVNAIGGLSSFKEYTFFKNANGAIFAFCGDSVTTAYELVYVIGAKAISASDGIYGSSASYDYYVQYYTLDGLVNYEKYYSVAGTPQTGTSDPSLGGWYLKNNTANGTNLTALTTSAESLTGKGYKIINSDIVTADIDLSKAASLSNGALITSGSAFLYGYDYVKSSAISSVNAKNPNVVAFNGKHVSTLANTLNVTNKVVVAANSSNSNKLDVVAAWIPAAINGSSTTLEVVYVAGYNGQVTAYDAAVAGSYNSYEYTVFSMTGEKSTIVVTNQPKANALDNNVAHVAAGKFYTLTENVNGSVTLAVASDANRIKTEANANNVYESVYVVDGVTHMTIGSADLILDGAKVVDLRLSALLDPTTAITTTARLAKTDFAANTVAITAINDYTAAAAATKHTVVFLTDWVGTGAAITTTAAGVNDEITVVKDDNDVDLTVAVDNTASNESITITLSGGVTAILVNDLAQLVADKGVTVYYTTTQVDVTAGVDTADSALDYTDLVNTPALKAVGAAGTTTVANGSFVYVLSQDTQTVTEYAVTVA